MQIYQVIILTNTISSYIFVVNSPINVINQNFYAKKLIMQIRRPKGVLGERGAFVSRAA